MTLHQLTHAATFEIDLAAPLLRLLARLADLPRGWAAQRRLDREMAMLDHRELADLTFRM